MKGRTTRTLAALAGSTVLTPFWRWAVAAGRPPPSRRSRTLRPRKQRRLRPVPPAMTLPTLHVVLDDPRLARARDLDRAKDPAGALRAMREARPADLGAGRSVCVGLCRGTPRARRERDGRCAARLRARGRRRRVRLRATRRCGRRRPSHVRGVPTRRSRARGWSRRTSRHGRGQARDRGVAVGEERSRERAAPCGALGSRQILTEVVGSTRRCVSRTRCSTASMDRPRHHAREAYDARHEGRRRGAEARGCSRRGRRPFACRSRAQAARSHRDRGTVGRRTCEAGPGLARARRAEQGVRESRVSCSTSTKTGPTACRAAVTRANAAAKARGVKLNGWPDAVTACEKDEQLVNALYSGAKAHASKDPKLAIDWFGTRRAALPGASPRGRRPLSRALLVAQSTDEGHEARAEQMLRSLPDAYPGGRHAHGGAVPRRARQDAARRLGGRQAAPRSDRGARSLTTGTGQPPAAPSISVLARLRRRGDADGARSRLVHIVERYPLAFYMLLAQARLAGARSGARGPHAEGRGATRRRRRVPVEGPPHPRVGGDGARDAPARGRRRGCRAS